MGILFDSVFLNGEKSEEIPAGEATMVIGDEISPTITKGQYAYFRGRRHRHGVYMREEPVRPDRKEQSDHESQD